MSLPAADVLGDLGHLLDAAGVDWYLFGAQAALLRGSRRSTADVDVTVFPGAVSTQELLGKLSGAFELRVDDRDGFLAQARVLPTVHLATQMPVDLVLGGPGLEEYFLSRSEPLTIGGRTVRVPLAEDLVVMKLLAGRSRDLEDATALVKAGADLSVVEPMIEAIAEGMARTTSAVRSTRSRAESAAEHSGSPIYGHHGIPTRESADEAPLPRNHLPARSDARRIPPSTARGGR